MNELLHGRIKQRARGKCEYCQLSQLDASSSEFHIQVVIPKRVGGKELLSNLALVCARCSLSRAGHIAGIDAENHRVTRLFSPRIDRWSTHFKRDGPFIVGKTGCGRATARILQLNAPDRVRLRGAILASTSA